MTEPDPTPNTEADWWQVADSETVWRVCRMLRQADDKDDCEHCPSSEDFDGERDCTRGCYMTAVEIVNVVETGNPWRKTEGVKPPWTARDRAASEEIGRLRLRIEQLERTSLSGAWVNVEPRMRWAQVQRQRFIGHLVETAGHVNRSDLMKKFSISQPQASVELTAFKRNNPEVITYDATNKRYVIARRALRAGESIGA